MGNLKHIGYNYLLPLFTFMAVGCSNSKEEGVIPPSDTEKVSIQLSIQNELHTRGALETPDNYQQVTDVRLYIFNGTTDDAQCIASEDVVWAQPIGNAASQVYVVKSTLHKGQEYLFLAVGTDKDTNSTYGLPDAITASETEGTPLGQAKAKLANGKSYTDIATAPLFAGSASITPDQDGSGSAAIQLNRRVAGVLCYLKNIPVNFKQPDGTGSTQVKYIQLVLNQNQNTSICLKKKLADDFGSDPSTDPESAVLVEFEINIDGTYEFDYAIDNDINSYILYNSDGNPVYDVFQGRFMLPIHQLDNTATLTIQALDRDKNLLHTWTLNNGVTSIYPLEANNLYSIGTKDAPIDLRIDEIILIPDYEVIYEIQ